MSGSPDIEALEALRLDLQAKLDGGKTSDDRNRMGQFATPTALAREILSHGLRLLPEGEKIRFLDPGIGTGSFYCALRAVAPEERIDPAEGFEIDAHYGEPARALWQETPLDIRLEDFTRAKAAGQGANLLICNPPYVRHHHLNGPEKAELQHRTEDACGVKINGLSGLYCYFMGLSHPFMAEDGIAAWLIPSEFMGVNYGRMLKRYLLEKVTLLQIHRYDPADVQFDDALVSSAVVWIKNTPPPHEHRVTFSYGGTLAKPAISREVPAAELANEFKWTRYPQAEKAAQKADITLGDLLDIKRGLATGDNSFFIMDRDQIEERGLPMECFRPVLPGSRYLPEDEIRSDANGWPLIGKQLFCWILVSPKTSRANVPRTRCLSCHRNQGREGGVRAVFVPRAQALVRAREPSCCTDHLHLHGPKQGRGEAVPLHAEPLSGDRLQHLPLAIPQAAAGAGQRRKALRSCKQFGSS